MKERAGHHAALPWFETLPDEVQDEILDAWREGIRATPIVDWLRALGYDGVTKSRVGNYMGSEKGRKRLDGDRG